MGNFFTNAMNRVQFDAIMIVLGMGLNELIC